MAARSPDSTAYWVGLHSRVSISVSPSAPPAVTEFPTAGRVSCSTPTRTKTGPALSSDTSQRNRMSARTRRLVTRRLARSGKQMARCALF
ncbi:unnamed protein product [Coregonus sp. 'balchen']|nr:unnamed protein product [Coregonus sp. 'balchen']